MYFLTSVLLREIKGKHSTQSWSALVQQHSLPFPKARVALAVAIMDEENCAHRMMFSQRHCSNKEQLQIDSRATGICTSGCSFPCHEDLLIALALLANSENKPNGLLKMLSEHVQWFMSQTSPWVSSEHSFQLFLFLSIA